MRCNFGLLLLFLPMLVQANCQISAPVLNFGVYDPLIPVAHDVSTSMEVVCDSSLSVRVSISAGMNSGGSFLDRNMQQASGKRLNYNIYMDPGHNSIFGDGFGGSFSFTGIIATTPQSIPFYGRIPALQSVESGQYSDSSVITIEW